MSYSGIRWPQIDEDLSFAGMFAYCGGEDAGRKTMFGRVEWFDGMIIADWVLNAVIDIFFVPAGNKSGRFALQ